ncbi:MAG: ATP synthase F1 subunit epsilon [Oscillospiraceae bacterium]|nr:ATP synthase F1 subunit epsilon [Oscillospiraceae bacterium]
MENFPVHILAADEPFYEGPCQSISVPTTTGMYGVLAHHTNVILAIVPGTLRYRCEGEDEKLAAVSAGLMKVENGEVLILVDSAERPEEIDANRAQRAADRAKEELLQKKSIQEYRMAQSNLARALSRLQVKSSANKH